LRNTRNLTEAPYLSATHPGLARRLGYRVTQEAAANHQASLLPGRSSGELFNGMVPYESEYSNQACLLIYGWLGRCPGPQLPPECGLST
jgi:hypothetical protein